ncbi:MAG: flippase-like domain-containing protein [Chloroflexi bacterium]|nr:flippase-like domain-containing protein [Chloroflexota bacterium]
MLSTRRALLGGALGALGLGLTFAGLDFASLRDALGQAQAGWLAPAALSVAMTLLVKALRWRSLFPPGSCPPVRPVVASYLLGQLANAVLPMRAGEVVRAAHLSRLAGPAFGAAAGTVVAEKLADAAIAFGLGAGLLGLGVSAGLAPPLPSIDGRTMVVMIAGLAALGMVLLAALRGGRAVNGFGERIARMAASRGTVHDPVGLRRAWATVIRVIRSPNPLTASFPRLVRDQLAAGFAVFRAFGDVRRWLLLAGWSALIWTLMVATNSLVFLALDLRLPLAAAAVLLLALQTASAVPSSIGRPGVFLFVTAATLGQFGVPPAAGTAAGLILFAVVFLPPIVGGTLALLSSQGVIARR